MFRICITTLFQGTLTISVQLLLPRSSQPTSRRSTRRSKRPEDIECRQSGDDSVFGNGIATRDDREEGLDGLLHGAVGRCDVVCDWDRGEEDGTDGGCEEALWIHAVGGLVSVLSWDEKFSGSEGGLTRRRRGSWSSSLQSK